MVSRLSGNQAEEAHRGRANGHGRKRVEENTHSEVALGAGILGAAGQGGSDLFGERVLAADAGQLAVACAVHDILRSLLECVPFKLDRHGGRKMGGGWPGRGYFCLSGSKGSGGGGLKIGDCWNG